MPDSWVFNFFGPPTKISLVDANFVWSGSSISDFSRIAVSIDKGETWTETANYPNVNMGRITGLATHPNSVNTAYALFSQANGPKVLKTNDLGQSWIDISGFITNVDESNNGFPDVATYSLLVMPFDTNRIWAGTEIGLFESLDGGSTWVYSDNGLPAVGIWEMKIVNDEIILATHGRGIWTVSMPELVANNDVYLNTMDFSIYPNPMTQSSTIIFETSENQNVILSMYSLDGKLIKNIFNGSVNGEQTINVNRNNIIAGTYLISLKTKSGILSKKLVVH